jgi:hypothetical protein
MNEELRWSLVGDIIITLIKNLLNAFGTQEALSLLKGYFAEG